MCTAEKAYEFQELCQSDMGELLEIYKRDFECADWVEKVIRISLSRKGYIGVKLTDENGHIIAVSLATRGLYLTHANSAVYQKLAIYTIGLDVYTGGMVYVAPSLRGRGIAGRMNIEMKKRMAQAGVELFFCEMSSDRNGRFPGEISCHYYETELCLGEYKDYYYDASAKNSQPCPNCGCTPCHCSAKFYLFRVADSDR